jgi:putative endonuclease
MNTTDIGNLGEKATEKFLKKNGYKIIEKNIHLSHNEIDLIAVDRKYIVSVEVKTRSIDSESDIMSYGTPAQAVTRSKKTRTVKAAKDYLSSCNNRRYKAKQPRIDVVEVYLDKKTYSVIKINHIYDAFGAS